MGGITHHANGRRQPFSDSTTRGFRGKTVALVDTCVVGTRPTPLGLQHVVTAGGIRRRRGPESCPRTRKQHPSVRDVPGREGGRRRNLTNLVDQVAFSWDHQCMKTVKVQEAKTHLSALLVEVEQGTTINIARGRQTVARLVPVGGERELGFGGYQLPDTFFDELPEEELSAWEGA